mgnify:CR=1 FL=1
MKNDFLKYIKSRGYLHQCTNDKVLEERLCKSRVGYIGFDCTSDCLHAGSLLPLMLLRNFQKFGHTPILLLGGGTTLVGDPSGKDETRKILGEEEINKNKKKLKKIFERFLSFTSSNKAVIVDNYEWLINLNYISFLREIGKHFTINKMLTFESVKTRLDREQSLSYMEFNYMILQAYDFLELNKKENCTLQIGGSDQWGNIVNGTELIKRHSNKQAYGLTTPLITLASGAKMGKTESGAIWLDKKLLSAYDYWQFWRNTDDRDVIKFLKMFTDLNIDEINKMKNEDINHLKIKLANEATSLLHGKDEALTAEKTAKKTFEENSLGENLPSVDIQINSENSGINIIDLIVLSKIESSKSEIKRLIKGKGIKINNKIINDEKFLIQRELFGNDGNLKLSIGKKRHLKVKLI